jgi:peroxiredoxin
VSGVRGRRLAAGLALAGTLGLLAACGGATPRAGATGAGTSYESVDGTTTTWALGHRTGPVEVRGTAFDGTMQDVTAWRGDVVVINTWYAACPPCRAEIGDLVSLANDTASKGVHVLGIDPVDDAATAQAFARTFAVPYPSLQDTDGSAVAALQGVVPVNATPTTVVLDRQGDMYARIIGTVDGPTLRALVGDVLAEPVGPTATAG